MTRVAAVDCGTNTIRLLVADLIREETGRPRLEPLRRRNEIVRLGQGVDRTGRLDPAALERTLAAVEGYAADCAELGVGPGRAARRFVATSATRDASNREDFVVGVRRLLGVEANGADKLGVGRDFCYHIVKNIGNYGEAYDRNVGKDSPLAIERGLNRLWNQGGIMFAPPLR